MYDLCVKIIIPAAVQRMRNKEGQEESIRVSLRRLNKNSRPDPVSMHLSGPEVNSHCPWRAKVPFLITEDGVIVFPGRALCGLRVKLRAVPDHSHGLFIFSPGHNA